LWVCLKVTLEMFPSKIYNEPKKVFLNLSKIFLFVFIFTPLATKSFGIVKIGKGESHWWEKYADWKIISQFFPSTDLATHLHSISFLLFLPSVTWGMLSKINIDSRVFNANNLKERKKWTIFYDAFYFFSFNDDDDDDTMMTIFLRCFLCVRMFLKRKLNFCINMNNKGCHHIFSFSHILFLQI
jgi:hypothetical protein